MLASAGITGHPDRVMYIIGRGGKHGFGRGRRLLTVCAMGGRSPGRLVSSVDEPDGVAGRVGWMVVVTLGGGPVVVGGISGLIIVIVYGLDDMWFLEKIVRNF